MLLSEVRRRASSLGAERLDAMVHRENVEALAFWKNNSFELQDDDDRWSLLM